MPPRRVLFDVMDDEELALVAFAAATYAVASFEEQRQRRLVNLLTQNADPKNQTVSVNGPAVRVGVPSRYLMPRAGHGRITCILKTISGFLRSVIVHKLGR
jgi:hypothetical protein